MSWPKACLGEVAQVISGATPKSSVDEYWDGDIPWITPADLSKLTTKEVSATSRRITAAGLASCSSRILPERSVLLSSRAPIGHLAINSVPMATNQGFKSFVPDEKLLSPDFLYWWLKANTAYLQSLGRGATFKEVSKEIVESIEIPLPPIEEQLRIAAFLDKASLLKAKSVAGTRLIESLGLERLERLLADQEESLASQKLEDLCVVGAPITYGILQPGPNLDTGIPYVRPSEIKDSRIEAGKLRKTSKEIAARYQKSELRSGDILLTIVGTIGEVVIVPPELDGANITQSSCRIRVDSSSANPVYTFYYLKSERVKHQIERDRLGVAVERLNLHHVRDMEILLPSRDIQERFAAEVVSLEALASRWLRLKASVFELSSSLQHFLLEEH